MQDVAISLGDGPYHSGSTQGLYHPNHQVNKQTNKHNIRYNRDWKQFLFSFE